jgi:eukaryotic-like serine/threonine-protein kinase
MRTLPRELAVGCATFAPRARLGPYELLLELGRGGVATAIVARKVGAPGFEPLVVIKRVHRNLLENEEFSAMFRDEARLASSIRHANVASVIDVIETGSELCLVMEYFEALSLSALLAAAGPGRPPLLKVTSRIVSDVLAGLDAAHEASDPGHGNLGIVHRDLSPHNIICDIAGVSRIIDFGIAKAKNRFTQTKDGVVKGKIAYMAPEQIEARVLDRRADIFAVGIVLHELLTGRSLFSGEDEFETIRHILHGEVRPPSAFVTTIPPALDAVVTKALARSPSDRFATALAFQLALEKAMPPAPSRDVGVWVEAVGGATLGRRRTEILQLLMAAHGKAG